MKMEQSVPKRRQIEFGSRGFTQNERIQQVQNFSLCLLQPLPRFCPEQYKSIARRFLLFP